MAATTKRCTWLSKDKERVNFKSKVEMNSNESKLLYCDYKIILKTEEAPLLVIKLHPTGPIKLGHTDEKEFVTDGSYYKDTLISS